MQFLLGKRALVTGSSQGMGKELAKILRKYGAEVFVHGSRLGDKLARAAEYVGTDKLIAADLTQEDAAEKLYAATGDVDILILNASIQYKREWDAFTEDELMSQLNCNLTSSYRMIKIYSQGMKAKKWGRIITIGSVNQYNNHPTLSFYGVTKAAQLKLAQSVAKQLAPFGITVNNIAPGAIATPRNDEALSDPEFYKKITSAIPAGYIGEPDELNGTVLLLCSNAGRYIVGSDIVIDGGMRL